MVRCFLTWCSTQRMAKSPFLPGDLVEVRSWNEIQTTLDPNGTLESLPFMPEMAKYCGGVFRVWKRADKACSEGAGMRKLNQTVLLQDLRCDGLFHEGCQRACSLFWKEAWLKPVTRPRLEVPSRAGFHQRTWPELPSCREGRHFFQATELIRASTFLPWWDLRQYFKDLTSGNLSPAMLLRALVCLGSNQLQKLRRKKSRQPNRVRLPLSPAEEVLDLRPGELVEVRSRKEIEATLNHQGRNKGLLFLPEMYNFCGNRYRVRSRLEKMILDDTATMRSVKHTVILEGACCSGLKSRGCPRGLFHFWREAWLKRIHTQSPCGAPQNTSEADV